MERVYSATGLQASELALAINESDQTVSNWKMRGISKKGAIKVALKYKISLDWILTGVGDQSIESNGFFKEKNPENVPVARGRWVPVKAYSKMGMDGYFLDMYGEGNGGDGYIPSLSAGPRAYGIRGTGDSMHPAIRNGWYVVCDPDATPTPTEYVQVCLKDGRCTIKEYIGEIGGVLHLLAVNGNERFSFDMDEVESITAISDIVPPSKHQQEFPLMPIKNIKIEDE